MDWFEKLTGFREESPDQVRTNMSLDGSTISSNVNGRAMEAGRLEIPSLAELRGRIGGASKQGTKLIVGETVGDVRQLHLLRQSEGAIFQVASQFNLLEMVSPAVTPEAGVSGYGFDQTQGPACAIAAGAGTIFRNYFAAVNGQTGQSANNQIDCLQSVGELLGNQRETLWAMRNGYALASANGLKKINARLAQSSDAEQDKIRAALRIGLQWNTEVTLDNGGHLVTQAFCSALPVAYAPHPLELWERFARLVLEGAYEATFAAAVLNSAETGNNRLYLTLIGGGAFGNATEWILSAIRRALHIFEKFPLDVRIVSYGYSNPALRDLF
jgi:hypothetical protein